MSAPVENVLCEKSEKKCKIEATVVAGFENVAADEILERFGVISKVVRGHVFFSLPVKDIRKVRSLHAVENLYVVMNSLEFNFTKNEANKEKDVKLLSDIIPSLDWETGLEVWQQCIHFKYRVSPKPLTEEERDAVKSEEEVPAFSSDSEIEVESDSETANKTEGVVDSSENLKNATKTLEKVSPAEKRPCESEIPPENVEVKRTKERILVLPGYRVTCNRTGENHSFSSMEAAHHFGGEVNDYFHWNVDLKHFDIEIVLRIESNDVRVLLALTKKSLAKRHISHFGPTSLKATIAYCMLRLCDIKDGDVVCDPMCGGGSIPIEGAVSWPNARHICGDNHKLAWPRARGNINYVNKNRQRKRRSPINVDLFRWDTTNLPLKDNSVDVMVIDMPFGKKSGNKYDNRKLYPAVLSELARVTRLSTGRACLLTFDKRNMIKTLNLMHHVWRQRKTIGVRMGGLNTCVFLLARTSNVMKTPLTSNDAASKQRKLVSDSDPKSHVVESSSQEETG